MNVHSTRASLSIRCRRRKSRPRWIIPKLRFTPYAWAKLLFLRDWGPTEVGGFGICPTEPLLVEDLQLVRQHCSVVSVQFDDVAVADMFEQRVDEGLRPDQFARIWLHTHPGNSAKPSSVDEKTFARVFKHVDWTVMFILARGGETYGRSRFGEGPMLETGLQTVVDYSAEFRGSDHKNWIEEYEENVISDDLWELFPDCTNRQASRLTGSNGGSKKERRVVLL